MHPIQPFKYIYLFGIIALSLVAEPSFAESFDQTTRDKVKKIVMMLNIAAKEFQEGVSDGMVVHKTENMITGGNASEFIVQPDKGDPYAIVQVNNEKLKAGERVLIIESGKLRIVRDQTSKK